MNPYAIEDSGYASYYDEADDMMGLALGRIGAIVNMGALGGAPIDVNDAPPATPGFPVSGAPGQLSTPVQIINDAAALRALGYAAPPTGNAYDPRFRAAVASFQEDVAPEAGVADGLIGPTTRAAMKRRLSGGGSLTTPQAPYVIPPNPLPGPVGPQIEPVEPPSPPGGVAPAAAKSDDDTMLYVGLGVGVVALLGLAYYATK